MMQLEVLQPGMGSGTVRVDLHDAVRYLLWADDPAEGFPRSIESVCLADGRWVFVAEHHEELDAKAIEYGESSVWHETYQVSPSKAAALLKRHGHDLPAELVNTQPAPPVVIPTDPPAVAKAKSEDGKMAKAVGMYIAYIRAGLTPPPQAEIARKAKCHPSSVSRAIGDWEKQRQEDARRDLAERQRRRRLKA
jgi:hypothetical protein